ncbi:hypothetical protein [Acrocarpospora corrugata]|uniref:hypothetical protein n=1 Tax=Acrocarpospora corrugata TaxID=35763 RepID=UPI0012D2B9BA|nr:hypothetical protein [Acrocarpospora corrugata]
MEITFMVGCRPGRLLRRSGLPALPAGNGIALFSFGLCPGREFSFATMELWWTINPWLPITWYAGAPAVILAFLAHWLTTRLGRPRIGRIVARVLGALLLVVYGQTLAAFAVDMAYDRGCVESWGGFEGLVFFLGPDLAPTLAALCVFAAVRRPRHRIRRVLLSRGFRRGRAGLVTFALLVALPSADLLSGFVAPRQCDEPKAHTGTDAFFCAARQGDRFANVADGVLRVHQRRPAGPVRGRPPGAGAAERTGRQRAGASDHPQPLRLRHLRDGTPGRSNTSRDRHDPENSHEPGCPRYRGDGRKVGAWCLLSCFGRLPSGFRRTRRSWASAGWTRRRCGISAMCP